MGLAGRAFKMEEKQERAGRGVGTQRTGVTREAWARRRTEWHKVYFMIIPVLQSEENEVQRGTV